MYFFQIHEKKKHGYYYDYADGTHANVKGEMKMEYVVLICARNEEKYIGSCLASLCFQSKPPKMVIVVDDGSSDDTGRRAREFIDRLPIMVLQRPDRGYSALGSKLMAETYNAGLEVYKTVEWDFLLILGADTSIPPEYVKTLYHKMMPSDGVISGRYPGIKENYAAATGRFIRRRIIDALGGLLPLTNAWESSILFCAKFMGYRVRSFPISIYNLRPPRQIKRSYEGRGKAFKELGYYWPYAFGSIIKNAKKNGLFSGLQVLYGYLTHKPQDPLPEWALYNYESQREALKKKVLRLIKK